MLVYNALAILSESYKAIGNLGYNVVNGINDGLLDSPKHKLNYNRLITSSILYDRAMSHVILNSNGDKILAIKGIEVLEFNRILFCLKDILGINQFPAIPTPLRVYNTSLIGQGAQGNPGEAGEDAYVYVRYASDSNGTDYSSTPSSTRIFLSIKSSNIPLPDVPQTHTGNWQQYIFTGDSGNDGNDGQSQYIFQAWASDNTGTGFTLTFNAALKYTAFLVKNVNTPPLVEEFAGKWTKYIGENGTNGTNGLNGKTLLALDHNPTNGEGVDGDFAINFNSWTIFGPKGGGAWPTGYSIIGPPGPSGTNGNNGLDGSDGLNGVSAYLYIAYARDASGTDFTLVQSNDDSATLGAFDSGKDWIAILSSLTPIGNTINASNFNGLWTKYQGTGDRWTTTSTTEMLIATGTKTFLIEKNLAWSTGQSIVIADASNPANRMEGFVSTYNPTNGFITVSVANIEGSGTFTAWAVSLQAFITDPPTSYGGNSPSTVTVNRIPAGTNISGYPYDDLFENIYAPFLEPTFDTFSMSGESNPKEVGDSVSGTKNFIWSSTNSSNVEPNTIDIRDHTNNTDIVLNTANDGAHSNSITTVTKTSPSSHIWRIIGEFLLPIVGTFFRNYVVTWLWRKHWGTSTNSILNSAQILALTSSSLSDTNNGNYNFAAGGYKFFVWDDSLGSPTAITGFKDPMTNLNISMADSTDDAAFSNTQNGWSYAIVSVTNAFGIVSNKRVYRTKYQLGASIDIIVS